ncbi:MAG: CBS domain-containing protein [Gammaproteobacteria bacterium]|nr:CBS domain-containing protein [Gammaproteobacteria bacterium]NIR99075.1 CBS domain-containing protein [Gammaproteobacteria bacterium]NIT64707.1 CBS domain-containing protein [Gammaproteobacteria bacterium]NIV21665.1 CBS domain-containing protein [Gammaproteobacteria bacterium]NIX10627.1 CBS domain-containing protein [Gammaproteobacteria bacterium]
MSPAYNRLTSYQLKPQTPVYRYTQGLPEIVSMEHPATDVMTDLRRVKVVTVEPELGIDDALQKMWHTGVRLLIVTDPSDHVLGLITARDIMGEKPVSYISRHRVSRRDIQVHHIMTSREEIEALDMGDVERACVGDIVSTLQDAGRQHALILEQGENTAVRGIFSLTQIGHQLGVEIPAGGLVQSFAEIEALLSAR